MSNPQWSFSSLKTFEQCPKKYYHLKVAEDVQDSAGTAAVYGLRFHKAAEEYGKNGKKLPKEFKSQKKLLDTLLSIKGDKYFELEMGIEKTGEDTYIPCEFNSEKRWWRGIADYVVVDGAKGFSIDYKTSKSAKYADIRQLDAVAAALFLKFPELDEIKSGLVFTECNDFIRKTHYRENLDTYLLRFKPSLEMLENCLKTNTWNAKDGPLCGWCPVVQCEFNRPRR